GHDLDPRVTVGGDTGRERLQGTRGRGPGRGRRRRPPGQLDAGGRAGQVVVEVDAEQVAARAPGGQRGHRGLLVLVVPCPRGPCPVAGHQPAPGRQTWSIPSAVLVRN